jgi:fatty acid desaturase
MTEFADRQELNDRLSLIESMIAEGRRSTESWGWTFVLWGVAYYVAIAWAYFGSPALAWPVTMVVAGLITGIVASRKSDSLPETTLGRSMMSIWLALGISLFIFGICAGVAGHTPQQVFIAVIAVMLGMANATSSLIFRWKAQFGCALVWWTAAIVSLFGSVTTSSIVFLTAIFLCQIAFGAYMMISEARGHQFKLRKQGGSHA